MASGTTQPEQDDFGTTVRRATKALGDVFVPIIPAIVASGLLMGLTEGIDNALGNSLQTNGWWILVHTFSNASFVFLQILIGSSSARVFGGNEFLGGVIGMIMNHPSLINAWSIPVALRAFGDNAYQVVGSERAAQWLTTVTGSFFGAADASTSAIIEAGGIPQVSLGLVDVTLQGYQGHVIPVVVAVLLMCKVEKWLHAHVPDLLDLFVTPFATVLVTGLATMIVIGPLFSYLENLVLLFFEFLLAIPFGLGGAMAGALYPLTVVMGVHHMFNAFEAGLCAQTPPCDTLNPIISAANVAQGAACLAVFVKTASNKKRGLALPSGISALLGITEPAIYGVNLPSWRPFAAAMAGAAAGGAVSALLGLHSTAYGITGLFGYLITSNVAGYSLVLAVSCVVSFGLTWLLYHDDAKTRAEAQREAARAQAKAAQKARAAAPSEVAAEPAAEAAAACDDAVSLAAAEEPADEPVQLAAEEPQPSAAEEASTGPDESSATDGQTTRAKRTRRIRGRGHLRVRGARPRVREGLRGRGARPRRRPRPRS